MLFIHLAMASNSYCVADNWNIMVAIIDLNQCFCTGERTKTAYCCRRVVCV